MREWNELMETRATRDSRPMKPQVAVRALSQALADDAIVAADCGTVTTWAARHLAMRDRMLFSCSGSLATMANGLPVCDRGGGRVSRTGRWSRSSATAASRC